MEDLGRHRTKNINYHRTGTEQQGQGMGVHKAFETNDQVITLFVYLENECSSCFRFKSNKTINPLLHISKLVGN